MGVLGGLLGFLVWAMVLYLIGEEMSLRERLEQGCEEEIEQWKPYRGGGPTLMARLDGARLALEEVRRKAGPIPPSSSRAVYVEEIDALIAELEGESDE